MAGGTKLILAGLVVAGTTAYMAYLGAAQSWQYYLTPDECLADMDGLAGSRLRVSGKMAEETLRHTPGSGQVTFDLQGTDGCLPVVCTGTIPDNLAEGIEVVVEGRLDADGTLRGDKLLTKCAGKYAPEESPRSGPDLEDEKEAGR